MILTIDFKAIEKAAKKLIRERRNPAACDMEIEIGGRNNIKTGKEEYNSFLFDWEDDELHGPEPLVNNPRIMQNLTIEKTNEDGFLIQFDLYCSWAPNPRLKDYKREFENIEVNIRPDGNFEVKFDDTPFEMPNITRL